MPALVLFGDAVCHQTAIQSLDRLAIETGSLRPRAACLQHSLDPLGGGDVFNRGFEFRRLAYVFHSFRNQGDDLAIDLVHSGADFIKVAAFSGRFGSHWAKDSADQLFAADFEAIQIAENGERDLFLIEEGLGDPLYAFCGNGFDAGGQFIQREEAPEMHLLPREV